MDARALIQLHLELECVRIVGDRMVRIPCDNPDDLYRFYIARTTSGYVRYYAHTLPTSVYRALQALPDEVAFSAPAKVMPLLARDQPCETIFQGRSYTFAEPPPPDSFPDTRWHNMGWEIRIGGETVARAWSSRENGQAAELAVETHPEHRRRGYARQVASAWAHYILAQGKIAFYSHRVSNAPSAALAQDLGVRQYIEDVGYL
jgi:GNAT superfamily N-acetyltransferase